MAFDDAVSYTTQWGKWTAAELNVMAVSLCDRIRYSWCGVKQQQTNNQKLHLLLVKIIY